MISVCGISSSSGSVTEPTKMIRIEKRPTFKDATDLQSLANMLAPQYSQSQIREFYLNGLLPDFIGTDMDYWMLIRRYYALKEQYKGGT